MRKPYTKQDPYLQANAHLRIKKRNELTYELVKYLLEYNPETR